LCARESLIDGKQGDFANQVSQKALSQTSASSFADAVKHRPRGRYTIRQRARSRSGRRIKRNQALGHRVSVVRQRRTPPCPLTRVRAVSLQRQKPRAAPRQLGLLHSGSTAVRIRGVNHEWRCASHPLTNHACFDARQRRTPPCPSASVRAVSFNGGSPWDAAHAQGLLLFGPRGVHRKSRCVSHAMIAGAFLKDGARRHCWGPKPRAVW